METPTNANTAIPALSNVGYGESGISPIPSGGLDTYCDLDLLFLIFLGPYQSQNPVIVKMSKAMPIIEE